jgi:hypothetical protein
MIVRFFKSGISRGEAPINYLLGNTNHQGDRRSEAPEVLEGIPELTVDLINGIHRKNKYASGCLAFRAEDQCTREELHNIINKFKSVVAPGLSPDSINSLFVLHREPADKKTGLAGFHIHFILPMVQLDGVNAGKRWNPHPPGKESIEIMSLFTSTTNHEMDWKQVQPNPLRVNIDSFWKKTAGQSITKKADLLKHELEIGVSSGQLKDRDQLCAFIANDLGLTITRKGTDYLSVKFPGTSKAIRLKGPLFEKATNYERLVAPNSKKNRSVILTDLEFQTHKQRLSHLLQKRGQVLTGLPISNSITIKEITNGKHQPRERRNIDTEDQHNRNRFDQPSQSAEHLSGQVVRHKGHAGRSRRVEYPNPKAFHPSNEKTRDSIRGGAGIERIRTSRSNREPELNNRDRLQATSQTSGREKSGECSRLNEESRPSEWIPTGLLSFAITGAEINEQIRKLTIALSTASLPTQSAIQDQINALVGRREHLPRPK